MGRFIPDNLMGIDQKKARPKDLKKAKRPLVDTELEGMNDAVWKDSVLLDEVAVLPYICILRNLRCKRIFPIYELFSLTLSSCG